MKRILFTAFVLAALIIFSQLAFASVETNRPRDVESLEQILSKRHSIKEETFQSGIDLFSDTNPKRDSDASSISPDQNSAIEDSFNP